MNRSKYLFEHQLPVFLQDKEPLARFTAGSRQPYTNQTGAVTQANAVTPHGSEKRQTALASARIDFDTDAYIEHRLQTGLKMDRSLTRSRVIAQMLAERARDDTFERSQTILVPIIQDTMRAMHREYEKRNLAINARIAYQVGWILLLLRKFVGIALRHDEKTLQAIDTECETTARVNVTRRTPQIDEVKERLRVSLEEETK